MIWAVIWYWLLAVFTAADIITTKIVLANGGYEGNQFMAPVIDHLILIKFTFLLGVIVLVVLTEKIHKGSGWLPACGAAVITSTAVISNIWQIGSVLY